MVVPRSGDVVILPFPYSDLVRTKRRPAIVLADVGYGDWLVCQITSKPYSDSRAVEITSRDFSTGALRMTSYARPGKVTTIEQKLIIKQIGSLNSNAFARVLGAMITLYQDQLPPVPREDSSN